MTEDYCLRGEELANTQLYGRLTRYKPFDLDFETNIKPKLLLENIKRFTVIRDKVQFSTYRALETVSDQIFRILRECINSEFKISDMFGATCGTLEETRKILKKYSKNGGLAGWLVNIELAKISSYSKKKVKKSASETSWDENEPSTESTSDGEIKRKRFLRALAFLAIVDGKADLKNIIPKSMYKSIKDFLKLGIDILAEGYATKVPEDLLADIKYTEARNPNPESEAFRVDSIEGIRIFSSSITINGFEFRTHKDEKFLEDLPCDENKFILRKICFQDCNFNSDNNGFNEMGIEELYFQNCRFDKKFCVIRALEGGMRFEGCTFIRDLDISMLEIRGFAIRMGVEGCLFEKGSTLNISRIRPDRSVIWYIDISNTLFNGELKLYDIKDEFTLHMKNVSFNSPFVMKNIKIRERSSFENLFFPPIPSIQMDKSRKDLYEVMKTAGLEQQAKDFGILPIEKESSTTKFDYDAYQVAYNSGFLNPEYAAYFLGKSKVYLQKKRTQDKQKITRDSLPFKVDGKDIQYPVEALLAFKAKDWDTLKNLRKKYPIPTK